MAKRKRSINIEKMLKEGRGQGKGYEYKPWIRIQDVPSLGRVTRLKGIKTKRQHEFLSDMERDYFYMLEYSDEVVDIREQFPLLPLEDTLIIAKELGIEHPRNPKTGEYIVMTTDFLITTQHQNGALELARTIKAKDQLNNKRVLEKFEIERVYWEKREVAWGIVTENEIDKVIANNISFAYGYKNLNMLDTFMKIEKLQIIDLINEFVRRIIGGKESMRTICYKFDKDMNLQLGSGLSIFKYLLINKIINVDISKAIDVNEVINIESLSEDAINRVEAI